MRVALRLPELAELVVDLDLQPELVGDRGRRLARAAQRAGPERVQLEVAEVTGSLGRLRPAKIGEAITDLVGEVPAGLRVGRGLAMAEEVGDHRADCRARR